MQIEVDGAAIHVATGGRKQQAGRPAVIFVHGAGMTQSVWSLQSRYVAWHGHNVLAPDLPGHGRSGNASPLVSIDAMADWLIRFMDAAGLKQATLVGHSMGALIALAAAATFPRRVGALALFGAAPRMPVHPELLAAARANDPLAERLVAAWGHGATGHIGGNRQAGGWLMVSAQRLLAQAPPGVLYSDLAACNAYADGARAAKAVHCPTLVVTGDADRMTPARQGAKLAAAIADARLVTLADCGHMMTVERPDASLDALRDFLAAAD